MRRLSLLAAALALLAASPAQGAEIKCEDVQQIKPAFEPSAISVCNGIADDSKCRRVLSTELDVSATLEAARNPACRSMVEMGPALAKEANQSTSAANAARVYRRSLGDVDAYILKLREGYARMRQVMLPGGNAGPLGSAPAGGPAALATAPQKEKLVIRSAIEGERISSLNVQPPRTARELEGQGDLFAARNGADFMKRIFLEREQAESMRTKLLDGLNTAENNVKNGQSISDPSNRGAQQAPPAARAPDRGIDPMTLASLGSMGAGLASAMKSQNQGSSGMTGGATSPTPTSNPDAAGPSSPGATTPGTNLNGQKSSPPSTNIGTPVANDPTAEPRGGSDRPRAVAPQSPAALYQGSDISRSTDPDLPSSPGSSPMLGKASGSGGGKAGDDSGDRAPAALAKQESIPAGSALREDEGLPNFGGGLGGGLGSGASGAMGSSSGSPPPDPAAEGDGMKDLLSDMKDAAESGDGSSEEESPQSAGQAMESDDLFPRVRACYTRILKQGRVFNGLENKVFSP